MTGSYMHIFVGISTLAVHPALFTVLTNLTWSLIPHLCGMSKFFLLCIAVIIQRRKPCLSTIWPLWNQISARYSRQTVN